MSGAVAGRRRGFDQLCRQIAVSEVGAVFGIEVSRLARNTVEWFQLLDLCRRSNTVIVEDSHVYAPGRNDDDLVLGIKGTISASELSIIKARLEGGKRNKAMRGALYSHLPAGYVLNGERLSKDPDQQVQASIEGVFRAFLEAGSARAAAQLLRGSGGAFSGLQTWSGELAGCGLRPYSGGSEEPDDGRRLCLGPPGRAGGRADLRAMEGVDPGPS